MKATIQNIHSNISNIVAELTNLRKNAFALCQNIVSTAKGTVLNKWNQAKVIAYGIPRVQYVAWYKEEIEELNTMLARAEAENATLREQFERANRMATNATNKLIEERSKRNA